MPYIVSLCVLYIVCVMLALWVAHLADSAASDAEIVAGGVRKLGAAVNDVLVAGVTGSEHGHTQDAVQRGGIQ